MTQEMALAELLSSLGFEEKSSPIRFLGVAPSAPERFGPQAVRNLKASLSNKSLGCLDVAPLWFGREVDLEKASEILDRAEAALSDAPRTLRELRSNRAGSGRYLTTEELDFPGCDHAEIPIDPSITKLEKRKDAKGWAIAWARSLWFKLKTPAPDFIFHSDGNPFVYELKGNGDRSVVALFSDWGTGYYHSQYIAKHIGQSEAHQAIHLGDVYYTGTEEQFAAQFTPILEKYILRKKRFFAMNANHEMDSHGIPYFAFLQRLRSYTGADGKRLHPQQGSYFCLRNKHYQVIGLDTAFFGNGQLDGKNRLFGWLKARLSEGRTAGKVNILLTQNEAFEKRPSSLLRRLDPLKHQIDLWFWGDEHYAALYPPSPDRGIPFWGSCIGHGGFPYKQMKPKQFDQHHVGTVWRELDSRFDPLPYAKGMGSNGYCMLTLEPGEIQLRYFDWMRQPKHTQVLPVSGGRIV